MNPFRSASASELPKAYDASTVEDGIYAAWEASGAFNPDTLPERNQKGDPYCIVMPPPNRTGTLHMGHATMLAIEDLLIRFHRMQGERTLWIPGTDHAAIATQVKVEQELIKGGMKDPRRELGREKFLEKVVEFADASAKTIRSQVRKMGSSCDWSRERYTFDEPRGRAVFEVFKMMYEDGLIERGYRIVNWDPQFQTTLSDDEVETKEVTAKLLTFKYDKDFPIAISTTRPETKFGDTAVAVHPDDKRYKKFVGKTFTPTFCGKKLTIKVIADEAVEPEFGTGALGVTPAHSLVDAEMAERHGLDTIPVIGPDAKMLPEAGEAFARLTTIEARKKIEKMLKDDGLLEKVEDVQQNLPIAQRGGAAVEQLPMRQWFIRVNKKFTRNGKTSTLKQLMRDAVASKGVTIIPERFEKTYFHWIDNLRDWCISRQIWFGHRIPIWYRGEEMKCAAESPGAGWEQDPDTLDTWFSSGLWTFSALGWPNKKEWEEHRDYHPTAVLETGYDILFFWVARMILMSTYVLGEVPFKDVYLHGLVRDEEGRKMSKSLGNVIDPLDMIKKYGTDAVRLSLVMGTTPGQDVKLSEAKVEGFRNFTNKLWNISRFILMQISKNDHEISDALTDDPFVSEKNATLADRWIVDRLIDVADKITDDLSEYKFSSAGEKLKEFTWNQLADWYIEFAKQESNEKEFIFRFILKNLLKLWHPFMPFVTEHIWELAGFGDLLMLQAWPVESGNIKQIIENKKEEINSRDYKFSQLLLLVSSVRLLRNENGIDHTKKIEKLFLDVPLQLQVAINENLMPLFKLSNVKSFEFTDSLSDDLAVKMLHKGMIGIQAGDYRDSQAESIKIEKELAELDAYIASQEKKLKNKEFLAKAPEKVVATMKEKLAEAEGKRDALRKRL